MIQSFSDIITNSSSEVFILSTSEHDKVAKFLEDVANIMGINIHDCVKFKSITKDESMYYKGPKYRKGNLVIEEKYDNALPDIISAMIQHLDAYNFGNVPNVKRVERVHCG